MVNEFNPKCVGLISYNINSEHLNYGAVLHSYAFQQYLKSQSIDSVIIDYLPGARLRRLCRYPPLYHLGEFILKKKNKYPVLGSISKHPSRFFGGVLNWGFLGFKSHLRKYAKFQSFFTLHYVKTEHCYSYQDLLKAKLIEGFLVDTYVCESDVTWKLYHEGEFDDIFFLNFPLADNAKKVAYAPSISSRPFTDKEQSIIRKLTSGFVGVSCREKSGAEYLSKILSRKVEWCLDPVFLLDEGQYDTISVKPQEKRYLLLYNCIANDKEMVKESQRLADKLNLELIEISSFKINQILFPHKVKADLGIEEFLGYFKFADFVICNSFHGCCFSIIYKKQFFVFQRDTSDFRMKDITENLNCADRLIRHDHKVIPDRFSPIDYNVVYSRLDVYRKASIDFIQNNIIA